jgi:hypothetical protein
MSDGRGVPLAMPKKKETVPVLSIRRQPFLSLFGDLPDG